MKYMLTFVASSWCFHLLVYDARNHETEKYIGIHIQLFHVTFWLMSANLHVVVVAKY